MEKKKIAVVLTGGTIGSRSENTIIDVNKESPYLLLQMYKESQESDVEVEFDVFNPYAILSENLTPEYWSILLKQLRCIDIPQYAGVIVTHGSDTLPYTSAFLSIMLHDVKVPVIMVASNYELINPKSNGLKNFTNAVSYMNGINPPGVYCIYENNSGESVVYLGSRIQEADCYEDQFSSFGGTDFGCMKEGQFVPYPCDQNPLACELSVEYQGNIGKEFEIDESLSNQIVMITPYPGLSYENIHLGKNTKAVLHLTYHSGTACTEGEETSLLRFMNRCKEKGVDVYISSMKRGLDENYRTIREIMSQGGRPLYDISKEAAYVKLVIGYNQKGYLPLEFMEQNFFYESIFMCLDRNR